MTHISFFLYIINNYFKCATKITKQFKPQNLNLQCMYGGLIIVENLRKILFTGIIQLT